MSAHHKYHGWFSGKKSVPIVNEKNPTEIVISIKADGSPPEKLMYKLMSGNYKSWANPETGWAVTTDPKYWRYDDGKEIAPPPPDPVYTREQAISLKKPAFWVNGAPIAKM